MPCMLHTIYIRSSSQKRHLQFLANSLVSAGATRQSPMLGRCTLNHHGLARKRGGSAHNRAFSAEPLLHVASLATPTHSQGNEVRPRCDAVSKVSELRCHSRGPVVSPPFGLQEEPSAQNEKVTKIQPQGTGTVGSLRAFPQRSAHALYLVALPQGSGKLS